jgi:hypothetical protein
MAHAVMCVCKWLSERQEEDEGGEFHQFGLNTAMVA